MNPFVILFSIVFLFQIEQEPNILFWSKQQKLQWKDFKYVPTKTYGSYDARSALEIKANPYWENQLPNYEVIVFFDRNQSWTNDTVSTTLLNHENLHFDIYELYARKIRRVIWQLRNNNIKSPNAYATQIQKLLDELNQRQDNYDVETAKSLNVDEQLLWQKNIELEIDSLEKFSFERKSP